MAQCRHEIEEAWCADCNGTARRIAEEEKEALYEGILIERFLTAKYDGRCALVPAHPIVPGRYIGIAVRSSGEDVVRIGYICDACVAAMTE